MSTVNLSKAFEFLDTYSPHARNSDPVTSHLAAKHLKLDGVYQTILDTLKNYPSGLTIAEIQEITGIPMQTCSPRFAPLRRSGYIENIGKRRNRASNTLAIIWKVTDHA
jgi:Fic family protein